jgi:hypothetical protein
MSRTRKDSTQSRVLDVVKRDDGAFDLFLNSKPYRSQISEDGLPEELCVRFGFCGDEHEAILNELNQTGKKALYF